MENEYLKGCIIKHLPVFESGDSITAEDLFEEVNSELPALTKDDFGSTLSDMVANGEVRTPPIPPSEATKYCRLPQKGVATLPPDRPNN